MADDTSPGESIAVLVPRVTCEQCGYRYKVKTGRSDAIRVVLSVVVAALVALAIGYFVLRSGQ